MNTKYNRNARSFYTAAYRMLRQEANWQRGQAISNGRSTFYACCGKKPIGSAGRQSVTGAALFTPFG